MMKEEGKFQAKVIDHDLEVDDQMNLRAVHVKFDVIDSKGEIQQITSFLSMKGGAVPITLKDLVTMGFKGTSDAEFMALSRFQGEGKELKPLVLDGEKVLELTLENDTYNGKTKLKVKYINEPGRSSMKRMEGTAAIVNLGGLNISGFLAEARSKAPTPTVSTSAAAVKMPKF